MSFLGVCSGICAVGFLLSGTWLLIAFLNNRALFVSGKPIDPFYDEDYNL